MRVARSLPSPRSLRFFILHDSLLLVLLAILALAFLGGCAGTGRRGGSSLTDAIAEAAEHDDDRDNRDDKDDDGDNDDDDRDEPRHVLRAGRPVLEPEVIVVRDGPGCGRHASPGPDPDREPTSFFAGVSVSGASFHGDALEGSGTFALRGGVVIPDARERMVIEGELAISDTDPAPGIREGIENTIEFSAGIGARWYFTPAGTAAGLFALGGMRVGALHWDYASPLLVDDGWDVYEVESDWLTTYTPYVGLGMDLLHSSPVRVGVALVQGVRFYDGYTTEGFRNDVFDPELVSELRFEVNGFMR